MSSPAYVSWARERIRVGMTEAGRSQNQIAVYYDVKVNPDGNTARAAARRSLASRLPWADIQLQALGIEKDVDAFLQRHGVEGMIQHMPDEWLDAFCASGTPEQVAEIIQRMHAAGTDTLIFQPLDADPDCLGCHY
jgi:alkanesulfonate monooxygenase SsuD/methylene tetrahydromethanopterin reductase-like flavin-dependent oxidoreductase (luciferase family)